MTAGHSSADSALSAEECTLLSVLKQQSLKHFVVSQQSVLKLRGHCALMTSTVSRSQTNNRTPLGFSGMTQESHQESSANKSAETTSSCHREKCQEFSMKLCHKELKQNGIQQHTTSN